MKCFALVLAVGLVGLGERAYAQVIQFVSCDYAVITEARAHTITDQDGESGTSLLETYSASASASAMYEDPEWGLHTASGNASLSWSLVHGTGVSALNGHVGGIAEAFSNGLETYALGTAGVQIQFNVTQLAMGRMESQGTFNSDLWFWDGTAWIPYETGLNGAVDRELVVGLYRWDSGAGGAVSGSGFQSAGIDFSLEATAVPEPASLAILGGLSLALAARRSKRTRSN